MEIGPLLLLVHALMVTGEMFDLVVEHFATRHRVGVTDLRGHGRSRELPPPYTAAQLAHDLSRLLDLLDTESTAVLGYSQGGAIAQELVLDHAQKCNPLVLACTYAFNMAITQECREGHLVPPLIGLFGLRWMASLTVLQSTLKIEQVRARWMAELIAKRDSRLMLTAGNEAMAFDTGSAWRKSNARRQAKLVYPIDHHDAILGSAGRAKGTRHR